MLLPWLAADPDDHDGRALPGPGGRGRKPLRCPGHVPALFIFAGTVGPLRGGAARAPAGWQRADLHPISQPAAVAGRFVFYAAAGGRIRVVALDVRTGRTVWSKAASSAANAPGQPSAATARNDARIREAITAKTPLPLYASLPPAWPRQCSWSR